MNDYQLFIGGEWRESHSAERIPVIDPATEATIATVPRGNAADIDDAVVAATGGFHKAHGEGAAIDPQTGRAYRTQRAYLADLLGVSEYQRIFGK